MPTLITAVLAGRLFLILADIVVLSITWSTTFKNWKVKCNIPTISGVIFRDGECDSLLFRRVPILRATPIPGTIYFVYVPQKLRFVIALC